MFRRQKKEILCSEPLVYIIKGFMSHSNCDELIKFVADDLTKSTEIHADGTDSITTNRTGTDKRIKNKECKANDKHRKALSKLIDIKKCFFEHSIIINYKDGQQYKPHFDQTPALEYKRLATAICYLNDVEEGGETVFPRLNITVKPEKGDLLYFKYNYPDNNVNRLTLHAGRPVLPNQEKWIHTTWICEKRL
tara:strand:+ start:2285 stop:2863 length:579 start_codon:yes stop_codon:yes gene_type:complete